MHIRPDILIAGAHQYDDSTVRQKSLSAFPSYLDPGPIHFTNSKLYAHFANPLRPSGKRNVVGKIR